MKLAMLAIAVLTCLPTPAREQPQGPSTSKGQVEWVDLHIPIYPITARWARIEGEVKIQVQFHNCALDREHIEVLSGHPMLREAALASLRDSAIRCGPFRDESTVLVFDFKLESTDCDNENQTVNVAGNTIDIRAHDKCLETNTSARH